MSGTPASRHFGFQRKTGRTIAAVAVSVSVPSTTPSSVVSTSTLRPYWCFPAWILPLMMALLVHSVLICECLVQRHHHHHHHHHSIHITPASRDELYPPLLLIGGIAQTRSSWDHHLASLSRNRRVLVYECLGQGDHTLPSSAGTGIVDASLPAQARKLLETLEEILDTEDCESDSDSERRENENENDSILVDIDIAGFSFGGRVAMATACLQNDRQSPSQSDGNGNGNVKGEAQAQVQARTRIRIRRLHVTGVGCDRSDLGHLTMRSLPDVIGSDPSLRSFAWSILLATYSPRYLRGLPETTLERYLDFVASSNHPEGLLAMLDQAEIRDSGDPWHVTNMAGRVLANPKPSQSQSQSRSQLQSQPNHTIGKLCVGEFDAMAPVDEVERLRETSSWVQTEVDVVSDCGHAVVMEKPLAWRASVLSFLNAE